jgi:hypothetical protein
MLNVVVLNVVAPFGNHVSTCGLNYKHVMIVNYASSSINKLRASLNDDAGVVIYGRHMFIVQATGGRNWQLISPHFR